MSMSLFVSDHCHGIGLHKCQCQFQLIVNFGVLSLEDIKKRKVEDTGCPVDLYVAGPPCQGFSNAGKKKGWLDERSSCMLSSVDYITAYTPAAFVLENVPALRTSKRTRKGYLKIKKDLKLNGYRVFTKNMRTSEHGLPQNRLRLYMVGFHITCVKSFKKFKYKFPAPLKHAPLHPRHLMSPKQSRPATQPSKTFRRNLKRLG